RVDIRGGESGLIVIEAGKKVVVVPGGHVDRRRETGFEPLQVGSKLLPAEGVPRGGLPQEGEPASSASHEMLLLASKPRMRNNAANVREVSARPGQRRCARHTAEGDTRVVEG